VKVAIWDDFYSRGFVGKRMDGQLSKYLR
jgi:hypothetical protein